MHFYNINLVVVFTDFGCTSCDSEIISQLNRLSIKYSDYINVYYIGNGSLLKNSNVLLKLDFKNSPHAAHDSSLLDNRLNSRILAEKILGKTIKSQVLEDVISGNQNSVKFDSLTFVIMLTDLGGNRCQNRELKNLAKLNNTFSKNKKRIIGIFNDVYRNSALKLKKVTGANFPLFFGNSDLFTKFSFSEKYPQIFVVKSGLIFSSFLPIPFDDEFSKDYYSHLLSFIDNNE